MPDRLARIGVFADAHYAPKVYGDRHCPDALTKLQAAVETFNAEGLDLAICLGDIVDAADSPAGEIANLRAMGAAYSTFRGRRHLVLGNHDVGAITKADFLENCLIRAARAYYSFDHASIHVAVLDSNCHADGSDFAAGDFAWDHCWVSQEQLDWLESDLAAANERPTLLCCHARLDPGTRPDSGRDPHVLENATAVRAVIEAAGNVQVVLTGHDHAGMHSRVNGVWYLGLRAMVTGPGPQNTCYGILSLMASGAVDLVGYGQQPSGRFAP